MIDFTVTREKDGKTEHFGHTLLVVGYNTELDQFVLKNPNQPSPGIELMSTEELKRTGIPAVTAAPPKAVPLDH